ncbi:hypothetical protein ACKLNO_04330 [Neisseriaceae bacterium B1]
MQQFEIGNYAKKQLNEYLVDNNTTLKEAMNNEAQNPEIAAILHAGLPTMVRKIYSLPKFQTFFWEKRDLLEGYIAGRLVEVLKPAKK